jgi:RloB-like protein
VPRRPPPRVPRGRGVGSRLPKTRIAVVCEGAKTEPSYLKSVEAHARSALLELIIVDESSTLPKHLVERACQVRRDATRIAKRSQDPNEEIEHVWCVFDVDEHPQIAEACQQATDNDIKVAITNPAIELWFLLHFQTQTAFIHRHDALARLKEHLPTYSKRLDTIDLLLGRYEVARSRAVALAAKHEGDGTTFPDDNPSSGLFHLIDLLGGSY